MSFPKELVAKMGDYRDEFGVIVQADRDGGDTCNRIAHYYAALEIIGGLHDDLNRPAQDGFYITLQRLTALLPFGRFRRHPDSKKWYSNPNNVTRDQMHPMICAMVLLGTTEYLRAHLKLRLRRGMLHFSTQDQIEGQPGAVRHKLPDLPSPIEIAVIIRGLNWTLLKPVLWLLDFALLREVKRLTVSNTREGQILLAVAVALRHLPTTTSKKAYELLESKKELFIAGVREEHQEGPGHNGILPLGELMAAAMEAL